MMRCKTARALMMERLYEPPVPEEAAQLEIHLAACPTCAAEWDEVQRAHAILRKFQDPAVPLWLERKVTAASRADSTLGIGIPERRVRVRLWMKLAAAASFEDKGAPSLESFLHELEATGGEVKRDPDAAGGAVRVLTAHGA
ncbi:MAG TPA: zf-HC2 domain-containing protein, partial [bacterium]|nr:zf-HC2 domain-containing protein [bacterium]